MKHHYFGETPRGTVVLNCTEHGDSLVELPRDGSPAKCLRCLAELRRAKTTEREGRLVRARERRRKARGVETPQRKPR